MDTILVAICGLGSPDGPKKINGCLNNIHLIKNTAPTNSKIDFKIFCYDDLNLDQFLHIENCQIIKEEGIVGQFIYRHLRPDNLSSYSRLILLMDDIKLSDNFNLASFIEVQDKYVFDIISPSATPNSILSRDFMKQRLDSKFKNKTLCVNFVEFFFYMFNLKNLNAYPLWHSMFSENTKWMWGIDLVLNPTLGLQLGLVNDMTFHHEQYGGGLSTGGQKEAQEFLKKFDQRVCSLEKNLKISKILSMPIA